MKLKPTTSSKHKKNIDPIPAAEERKTMNKKKRTKLPQKLRLPISPILLPSHKEKILALSLKEQEEDLSSTCTHGESFRDEYSSVQVPHKKRPRGQDENHAPFRRITRSYYKNNVSNNNNKNEVDVSDASCVEKETVQNDDLVSFASNSAADSCLSSFKTVEKKIGADISVEASTKSANEVVSDLDCGEKLSSYGDDEDDVVSDYYCVDEYNNSNNYYSSSCPECSSDSTPSMLVDTGSQFSEKSAAGEWNGSPHSPTFSLLLEYRCQFSRFSCFPKKSSVYQTEHKFVRFEDEEEEESYVRLRERERRQVLCCDYGELYRSKTDYGDLIVEQRSLMVHWIVEHSGELQPETMFLAVSLLDRFLSKGFFKSKRNLQIAGVACLTLATRIEENQPYNSVRKKNFHVATDVYSRHEVVAMEWLVQEVLNFECFSPTIYNFLWFYLKASGADQQVNKRAKYLAVLAMSDTEQLGHWPSTVAAALVILASLESNQDATYQRIIEIHVRTKENDLHECMKRLEWLLQFAI